MAYPKPESRRPQRHSTSRAGRVRSARLRLAWLGGIASRRVLHLRQPTLRIASPPRSSSHHGKTIQDVQGCTPAPAPLSFAADFVQGKNAKSRGGDPGQGVRGNYDNVPTENAGYEKYYREASIIPDDEWPVFWETLKKTLPTTFRFTGSKACVILHALLLPSGANPETAMPLTP